MPKHLLLKQSIPDAIRTYFTISSTDKNVTIIRDILVLPKADSQDRPSILLDLVVENNMTQSWCDTPDTSRASRV